MLNKGKDNYFEGLFKARLRDNGLEYSEDDFKRFCNQINKSFEKGLLDLSGQRIGINVLTKLTKVLRLNTHIKSFNFYGNLIRDHGIHSLYQLLLSNPQVRFCDIGCNDLTNQSATCIIDIINNTGITSLQLGSNGDTWHSNKFSIATVIDIISTAFAAKKLQCLGLNGFAMSSKKGTKKTSMCEELSTFIQNDTTLSTLCIAENALAPKEQAVVNQGLLSNDRLRYLDMHGSQLQDPHGLLFLSEIGKMKKLVYLNIANCHLSSSSGASLGSSLKKHPMLSIINLSDNEIGDDGFCYIVDALILNQNITEVNFSNNKLTSESAVLIEELLTKNQVMYSLDFSKNSLGDLAAQAIARALRANNDLSRLILTSCRISDNGAIAIARALAKNRSLKYLKLSDNFLTRESGYCILENIRKNECILTLDLSATQIDHFVAKAIKDICKRNLQIQREFDLQPLKKQIVQLSIQRTKMPEAVSRLEKLEKRRAKLENDVENTMLDIDDTIASGNRIVTDLIRAIATANEMTQDEFKAVAKDNEEKEKMIFMYNARYEDIVNSTQREITLERQYSEQLTKIEVEIKEEEEQYKKDEDELEKKILELKTILEQTLEIRQDPEKIKVYEAPEVDYGDVEPIFLVEKIVELKAMEKQPKKKKKKSPKKKKTEKKSTTAKLRSKSPAVKSARRN